jgi:hypothetical protein
LVSLVTKEVDVGESFVLDVTQAVSLVPSSGEDIERDLSTDGVGQVKVGESSLQVFNKLLAKSTFLKEVGMVNTLCLPMLSDHSPELTKSYFSKSLRSSRLKQVKEN